MSPAGDPWAVAAAHNNARWCDTVCATHGIATAFDADAWVAATRSPPAYPDAVTLRPTAPAEHLLARVDRSPGCSVKDSFASLDLSGDGFTVLFDATWIYRPATVPTAAAGALRWSVVTTNDALRVWAAAHGGGPVFTSTLLEDPTVAVLVATAADGSVAAGAIGNRSHRVVGLSNLFTVGADRDEVWAGAVTAVSAAFAGLPIVGYEHGDDLTAAHHAGFTGVGQLRVWVTSR